MEGQEVIKKIRTYCRTGRSPTSMNVRRYDRLLYRSALQHFGGWRAALQAAGVELRHLRLHARGSRHHDAQEVLDEVRAWGEAGHSLQWGDVCLQNRALPKRGSPLERKRNECMSRERVIHQIIEREQRNLKLSEKAVQRHAKALYESAREHFGTWDTALLYAGVSRHFLKTEDKNSRSYLIWRIRDLCLSGYKITAEHNRQLRRQLYEAAIACFGSWDEALAAAGINPENVTRKPEYQEIGRQRIIELLQQRRDQGLSLIRRDVFLDEAWLGLAAKNVFRSYRSALIAAGIPPHPFTPGHAKVAKCNCDK